jgi:hypothetical protein
MVSEISVHGHLTLLFLSRGRSERQGRECVVEQRCLPHGSWKGEREKRSISQGLTPFNEELGLTSKILSPPNSTLHHEPIHKLIH